MVTTSRTRGSEVFDDPVHVGVFARGVFADDRDGVLGEFARVVVPAREGFEHAGAGLGGVFNVRTAHDELLAAFDHGAPVHGPFVVP